MEEADAQISEMEAQLDEIEEMAAEVKEPKKVFVEVGSTPEIYTTGKGTFIDEMLSAINAENIAGDQEGWVSIDPEAIVSSNPDVIVTTEGAYVPNAVELIMGRNGFAETTAVQDEAVYNLDSDKLTRQGPRVTEGLLELARAVYPEVYGE